MFEIATRGKWRFPTSRGSVGVEDLWDLPLENQNGPSLEGVAVTVHDEIQELPTVSFVRKTSPQDAELSQKLELVKYIIAVKLKEQEAYQNERQIAERRQKLLSIKAQKQDEAFYEMTPEELDAALEQLG